MSGLHMLWTSNEFLKLLFVSRCPAQVSLLNAMNLTPGERPCPKIHVENSILCLYGWSTGKARACILEQPMCRGATEHAKSVSKHGMCLHRYQISGNQVDWLKPHRAEACCLGGVPSSSMKSIHKSPKHLTSTGAFFSSLGQEHRDQLATISSGAMLKLQTYHPRAKSKLLCRRQRKMTSFPCRAGADHRMLPS